MLKVIAKIIIIVGAFAASAAYGQSEFPSRFQIEADGVMTMRTGGVSLDEQKNLSQMLADLILNGNFEDSDYLFSCHFQGSGALGQGSRNAVLNLPLLTGDPRIARINIRAMLTGGHGVKFSGGCSENHFETSPETIRNLKKDLFAQKLDGKVPTLGRKSIVFDIIPVDEGQGTLAESIDFSQPLSVSFKEVKFSRDFEAVTNNGTSFKCSAAGECQFTASEVKEYILSTGPKVRSPDRNGGKIFLNADSGTLSIGYMGSTNYKIVYDKEFSRLCSESALPLRAPGFVCNASVRLVDNKPVIGQVDLSLNKKIKLVNTQGRGGAPALFGSTFYDSFLLDDQELTESFNNVLPGLSVGTIVDGGYFSIQKTLNSDYLIQFRN